MTQRWRAASHQFTGFLDQGTTVHGELSFSGALRVDGIIHGSIATRDLLVIGPSAEIRADIRVGEVEVHGLLIGDVEASQRVTLCAGSRLVGNVSTPRLVIEEGSRFDGFSRPVPEAVDGRIQISGHQVSETAPPESLLPARARWQEMSRSLNRHWETVTRRTMETVKRQG